MDKLAPGESVTSICDLDQFILGWVEEVDRVGVELGGVTGSGEGMLEIAFGLAGAAAM